MAVSGYTLLSYTLYFHIILLARITHTDIRVDARQAVITLLAIAGPRGQHRYLAGGTVRGSGKLPRQHRPRASAEMKSSPGLIFAA